MLGGLLMKHMLNLDEGYITKETWALSGWNQDRFDVILSLQILFLRLNEQNIPKYLDIIIFKNKL